MEKSLKKFQTLIFILKRIRIFKRLIVQRVQLTSTRERYIAYIVSPIKRIIIDRNVQIASETMQYYIYTRCHKMNFFYKYIVHTG